MAEQIAISGTRLVLGLTSAGRASSMMPVPGLVSITSSIRDEGTSYHYLPPAAVIDAPSDVARLRKFEIEKQPLPFVLELCGLLTPPIAKKQSN